MRTIKGTNQFKRDRKRETKGKSAAYVDKLNAELFAVVTALAIDKALQDRLQDHALSGDQKGRRECHVRPDLLLIYRKPDDSTLELIRFGSHSELGLK